MDPRIRFLPAVAAALLIVARAVSPTFLAQKVHPWLPSVWWLVFLPTLYVAAYLITPTVMRLLGRLARRAFLPPVLILAFIIGLWWFFELVFNHTVASWVGPVPEIHWLARLADALSRS